MSKLVSAIFVYFGNPEESIIFDAYNVEYKFIVVLFIVFDLNLLFTINLLQFKVVVLILLKDPLFENNIDITVKLLVCLFNDCIDPVTVILFKLIILLLTVLIFDTFDKIEHSFNILFDNTNTVEHVIF